MAGTSMCRSTGSKHNICTASLPPWHRLTVPCVDAHRNQTCHRCRQPIPQDLFKREKTTKKQQQQQQPLAEEAAEEAAGEAAEEAAGQAALASTAVSASAQPWSQQSSRTTTTSRWRPFLAAERCGSRQLQTDAQPAGTSQPVGSYLCCRVQVLPPA